MGDKFDAETALAIELWNREHLQGVSSRLLGVEDAGATEIMMMCSPQRDHGPARWHRDFSPSYCSPLQGYVDDILENGPRYVQWNLPLYDDNVLWVVPGSHVRFNTEKENAQLTEDDAAPLSSGIQTELNRGRRGRLYPALLHWGSNYSTRLRRTVHGGFSIFTTHPDLRFLPTLARRSGLLSSAGTRAVARRWWRPRTSSAPHSIATRRATTAPSIGCTRVVDRRQAAIDDLPQQSGSSNQTAERTRILSPARAGPEPRKERASDDVAVGRAHRRTLYHNRSSGALKRYEWMDEALHSEEEQLLTGSGPGKPLPPAGDPFRGQPGILLQPLVAPSPTGASIWSTNATVWITSRRSVPGILPSRMQSRKCSCIATWPS